MAELKCTGMSEITIDARDSLSVVAEPIARGERVRVTLGTYRVLDMEGFVVSPVSEWITVYENACKFLFFVNGRRNEEEIRVLTGGPDEEKNELLLERVCCLSLFAGEEE